MVDGRKDTALGLGERLRSARKGRALTLQQAAFTLRLEESVLRALEDERYEVLGAAVFVRGHLKAYAKLLGLSEEVVLTAYRASDPSADAPPKVTRELEKPLTTTPGPIAILLAVALAVLAILLLYLLSTGDEPARPVTSSESGVVPAIETVLVPEIAPIPAQLPSVPPAGTPAGESPQSPATSPVEAGEVPVEAVSPAATAE
ncbi:MAG: helix-turn-helix transcriptional regulator [Gammaproteobacteria bacterium]|nr:helix-turn-helix transcriptional regulator [Gammaproteobacteria bacterium]